MDREANILLPPRAKKAGPQTRGPAHVERMEQHAAVDHRLDLPGGIATVEKRDRRK